MSSPQLQTADNSRNEQYSINQQQPIDQQQSSNQHNTVGIDPFDVAYENLQVQRSSTRTSSQKRPRSMDEYVSADRVEKLWDQSKKTGSDFALKLLRECFSSEELESSTISGKDQFDKFDADKVRWIIGWVFKKLPPKNTEKISTLWCKIQNSIDTGQRLSIKNKGQKNKN